MLVEEDTSLSVSAIANTPLLGVARFARFWHAARPYYKPDLAMTCHILPQACSGADVADRNLISMPNGGPRYLLQNAAVVARTPR